MLYISKTLVSLTVWEENIIEGKKSDLFGVRGLAPAAISSLLSICFYERVMHTLHEWYLWSSIITAHK